MSSQEDNDVQEQIRPKIYGSSIRREPVAFVPAGQSLDDKIECSAPRPSLGDKYLAIVLKRKEGAKVPGNFEVEGEFPRGLGVRDHLCEICGLSTKDRDELRPNDAHDLSLAHQVCVHHSYPPSHIDRKRPGLKYLSSYGWDVDSRRGLGAAGDGRLAPVKATAKNNTVGLGMDIPKDAKKVIKPVLLDAGRVRKKEMLDKQKRARLQEMFYRNEDVDKYLGGGSDFD